MPEMKKPSLAREIGRVAWSFTRILVPVAVFVVLLLFLLRHHPILAVWACCSLMIVGQILFYGWQDYKWKKKDWKRQQGQEARERTAKNAGSTDGGDQR